MTKTIHPSNMKLPAMEKLPLPALLNAASRLPSSGRLARSKNKLSYLNIEDAYIHDLFPLLQNQAIKIPDYFGKQGVGAHISVIYPEEKKEISDADLGQEHDFLIKDLIAAKINQKIYYALFIEAPSLLQLRRKYGLTDLLCFKNYAIGFHITIGTKEELPNLATKDVEKGQDAK